MKVVKKMPWKKLQPVADVKNLKEIQKEELMKRASLFVAHTSIVMYSTPYRSPSLRQRSRTACVAATNRYKHHPPSSCETVARPANCGGDARGVQAGV